MGALPLVPEDTDADRQVRIFDGLHRAVRSPYESDVAGMVGRAVAVIARGAG